MKTRLCVLLSFVVLAASGPAGAHDPAPSKPDGKDDAAPEAVRQLVETYGQAIETHDVALFRSLMPGLSIDAEKRLHDAFKEIHSQEVRLTIRSVDLEETKATVHVLREDTIDGWRMKPVRQNLHLVREDDRWQIQSLSVDR